MSTESEYKKLFENGEHAEAVEFLKESKEEFDLALYHYNLGVNYVRLEQLPLGRYHFEKAKDTGFQPPELRESLERVKKLTGADAMEEKSSAMDYLYSASLGSSVYTGVNISLVLIIVLFTQLKKISRAWLKVVFAVLAMAPLAGQLYLKANYGQAVVMEQKAVLMGPSAIFEQSQELIPGMKIVISEEYNGWRYVVSPASHKGWVKTGELKEL